MAALNTYELVFMWGGDATNGTALFDLDDPVRAARQRGGGGGRELPEKSKGEGASGSPTSTRRLKGTLLLDLCEMKSYSAHRHCSRNAIGAYKN